MDMSGERLIQAPRAEVWRALNDEVILQQCIPGCESIVRQSESEMTAVAKVKIGPMAARFSGKVSLLDIDPPNGYRIVGEGQGGAAGFAKGAATVQLEDRAEQTLLTYSVNAQVGGKMAQIGARLIDATAKSLADQFFTRFAETIGQSQPAVAPDTVSISPQEPRPSLFARMLSSIVRGWRALLGRSA